MTETRDPNSVEEYMVYSDLASQANYVIHAIDDAWNWKFTLASFIEDRAYYRKTLGLVYPADLAQLTEAQSRQCSQDLRREANAQRRLQGEDL